uniref:Putative secreted peptide n=1 Tax=Anopheles braziliensis TaxID=58242 RepID=A0A2M3ZRK1_9DIPT
MPLNEVCFLFINFFILAHTLIISYFIHLSSRYFVHPYFPFFTLLLHHIFVASPSHFRTIPPVIIRI